MHYFDLLLHLNLSSLSYAQMSCIKLTRREADDSDNDDWRSFQIRRQFCSLSALFPQVNVLESGREPTPTQERNQMDSQPASQRKNEMGQTVGEEHTRELLKRGNGDSAARRPRKWSRIKWYKGVTMVHAPKFIIKVSTHLSTRSSICNWDL